MTQHRVWRRWLRPDSRFGRNVFQVARANVLAQALPLIAAPLLSRLYTPADFGALALFGSVLSLALAVATGRFDWSVPNARSPRQAAALLMLGTLVLASTLALAALLLAAAWWWLPRPVPDAWRGLGLAALLLPLALLGAGAQQLLQAWHVMGAELSALGRSKVAQSAANVALALVAAPFGAGPWGLCGGVLAGAWIGLRTLSGSAVGLRAALERVRWRTIVVAWRRFRGEAAWSTLVSAVNTASFAIVPLLLARHYSVTEVGFYALMQRVALGPVGLIGAAVGQSFWAEAARLVRQDPSALRRLYLRNTRRLAWLALPLALLALAGPLYVGPLFGRTQWADAGWVLAASVPMLVGQLIASPLSHLVIHRRQHWQAAWDALRLLLLVAVIEGCGRAGAALSATALALSLVMALMYALLLMLNLRALRLA